MDKLLCYNVSDEILMIFDVCSMENDCALMSRIE